MLSITLLLLGSLPFVWRLTGVLDMAFVGSDDSKPFTVRQSDRMNYAGAACASGFSTMAAGLALLTATGLKAARTRFGKEG